jgi:hypothetical protein
MKVKHYGWAGPANPKFDIANVVSDSGLKAKCYGDHQYRAILWSHGHIVEGCVRCPMTRIAT